MGLMSVMELIAGHILPQCSILLTSRPHAVAHIEPSFENVLQIKGFSRDHAEIFCDRALHSKDQKNAVVLFYENNFMRGGITFASPMLLQFICILVENDTDLDLARNKVAKGEIYWRLVRCIYRKYCEGRNVRFNHDELTEIFGEIGKFALKTMKNEQNCFQRGEIIRELGENAFELGFLVGYKDFRLVANETTDISVTFLHETLRIFRLFPPPSERLFGGDGARSEHSLFQRFD